MPPANRLAGEKSPYLLQHARNPVDWFAWGDEAFDRARRENKPIFLSIGYSTCHWCHVMAHESFEDEATADIMNEAFVNIKVDREERPDVDRVYMTFVQATTGGGGWPMSVWLTPDLLPFVAGTYFPPEDRYGHPGFKKVLLRIADSWRQNRQRITEQGEKIIGALREATTVSAPAGEPDFAALSATAYEHLARTFDRREGGFGSAPKFPRPATLNFLTRFHARAVATPNESQTTGKKGRVSEAEPSFGALDMVCHTLRKMAAGGIHDHLGGGFHRYSVDGFWHVPHFEKMLYDQAQLVTAYLDAFQLTHDEYFADVARNILAYVRRDLTAPEGGFYSAEDADSPLQHGKSEQAEGAFYVWTKAEIVEVLGQEADGFCAHYGVEDDGNAPAGADPHGEFTDKNILIQRPRTSKTAARPGRSEEESKRMLADARAKLLARRAERPRPHLDDKVIAAWNGLMISGFARAARILDDSSYLQTAVQAAEFLRRELWDGTSLARNFRDGRGVDGFADDYAFVIQGLLDLYEASFDVAWLKWAGALQAKQDELFLDRKRGGYFTTTGKDASVLLRMKEDNDSAEPAASSIAALNLARLSALRNDPALSQRARETVSAFSAQLGHFPTALPQMLVALDFISAGSQQ
ncbi:MAG: thioredoxin domain-containing protein, partial [Verrucomicrobiota bacterium]